MRGPPQVFLLCALEESPELLIDASSYEDEQRLRLWLRSSGALTRLVELLDELDDDEQAAAT